MGLPPDDATYLRYQFNRYRRLFEIRRNNFKKLVISEKRIPLRLTSAENIDTVIETLRDMELVKTGKLVLRPNGKLVPFTKDHWANLAPQISFATRYLSEVIAGLAQSWIPPRHHSGHRLTPNCILPDPCCRAIACRIALAPLRISLAPHCLT